MNGSPCPDISFSSFRLKSGVFYKSCFNGASIGLEMSLILFRISNSNISVRHSNVGIEIVVGAHGYRAEIQEEHEYHGVDSFGRRQ